MASVVLASITGAGLVLAEPTLNSILPSSIVQPDSHVVADVPSAMIGKKVLGRYQEFLGTIVSVNEARKTAGLKVPTGMTLELATDTLVNSGDHISAPTLSRGDILAMMRKPGQPDIREVTDVKVSP
jgi:hypothetical protein